MADVINPAEGAERECMTATATFTLAIPKKNRPWYTKPQLI